MARLPPPVREQIPQELRAAFDAAIKQRSDGKADVPRAGNYTSMLYSPEACTRLHHWANYLIKEGVLSHAIRELAFLLVAREHDSQYIWNAHAGAARKSGLSAGLVDALRDRAPLPAIKADEAAAIRFAQEYFRLRRVGKGTFQEALAQLGRQGLVELTMLLGFCAVLAFNLHAFDLDLPEQRAEPLMPLC